MKNSFYCNVEKCKKSGNVATFYISILIVFSLFLSSMFAFFPSWLSKIYDTTLCASVVDPGLDSSYFDYKSSDFISKFDFVCENVETFVIDSDSPSLNFVVSGLSSNCFDFFDDTTKTADTITFIYYGPNNVNGTSFYNPDSLDYYNLDDVLSLTFSQRTFAYTYYRNVFLFNSKYCIPYLITCDFVYSFSYNNAYFVGMSSSLYNKYLSYHDGLSSGSDDFLSGQNSVLNNPNDYGLYSKDDYDNNYNNGYSIGETVGENNVKNNPSNYDLYSKDDYDSNYNLGYSDSQNDQSTFKKLMFSIIDSPFNVLSNAFDFEIFGINLSAFLISIVSLLLVFFVIRKLL